MGTTEANLKSAFAGESQANRRYLAFAKKAKEEGFPQIARLFRAAAEAETVHAMSHLRTMRAIKSTAENLEIAIGGETYESTEMYPAYMETSEKESRKDALVTFKYANEVEKIHVGLYEKALEAAKNKKDLSVRDYYVCEICGNTVEDRPPDKCVICGASARLFTKIT